MKHILLFAFILGFISCIDTDDIIIPNPNPSNQKMMKYIVIDNESNDTIYNVSLDSDDYQFQVISEDTYQDPNLIWVRNSAHPTYKNPVSLAFVIDTTETISDGSKSVKLISNHIFGTKSFDMVCQIYVNSESWGASSKLNPTGTTIDTIKYIGEVVKTYQEMRSSFGTTLGEPVEKTAILKEYSIKTTFTAYFNKYFDPNSNGKEYTVTIEVPVWTP